MLRQAAFAFVLLGICLVIHIAGMVFVGDQLVSRREKIQEKLGKPVPIGLLLIAVFTFIMLLHLAEAFIWAGFYYAKDLFKNFETALYFSLKTYSTIGYGDVVLPERWRLLGTIEGTSGVLLCGVSTAFLFAIVSVLFQFRVGQHNQKEGPIAQSPAPVTRLMPGATEVRNDNRNKAKTL